MNFRLLVGGLWEPKEENPMNAAMAVASSSSGFLGEMCWGSIVDVEGLCWWWEVEEEVGEADFQPWADRARASNGFPYSSLHFFSI